jgi:precorrin-2/cobalt-factor-2 C20-methyltransferase
MDGVLAALRDSGRLTTAVVGSGLGLPGERIEPAAGVTGPLPYLSTVLAPPRRSARGEKL